VTSPSDQFYVLCAINTHTHSISRNSSSSNNNNKNKNNNKNNNNNDQIASFCQHRYCFDCNIFTATKAVSNPIFGTSLLQRRQ